METIELEEELQSDGRRTLYDFLPQGLTDPHTNWMQEFNENYLGFAVCCKIQFSNLNFFF